MGGREGEYQVNSAPRCSGHAGGMTDLILAGTAQFRGRYTAWRGPKR